MLTIYSNDTTRGVTVVVGLLLVLSILVIGSAQYQSTVIPAEEEEVELEHSTKVHTEFSQIRTSILTTAESGESQAQTITPGLRYEQRLIFGIFPAVHSVNPAGTVSTEDPERQIIVDNAINTGGASNYWSGFGDPCTSSTPQCYDTRFLTYDVNYNHYQDSPRLVYENTLFYDEYDSPSGRNVLIRGDQNLVNGRSINLVSLTGDASVSRSDTMTVETHPVSAPSESIQITNPDEDTPIRISVPTRLSESEWQDLLEEEMASQNGGFVQSVDVIDGNLQLTLAVDETYNLKLSRVHLRLRDTQSRLPEELPAYLAWEGSDSLTIREDSQQTVTAQVRDRFNNGVPGVKVNARATYNGGVNNGNCAGSFASATNTCDGELQPGQDVSDENGFVEFVYRSPELEDDEDITISLSIDPEEELLSSPVSTQPEETLLSLQTDDSFPTLYGDSGNSNTGALFQQAALRSPIRPALTNSGFFRDDNDERIPTLRVLDFQFEDAIALKGRPIRAVAIIDNTGADAQTDVTLSPNSPLSNVLQDVSDDVIIDRIGPGERLRVAFDITFRQTSNEANSGNPIPVRVADAESAVTVLSPTSTTLSGLIETEARENTVISPVNQFKDGTGDRNEIFEDFGIPPIEITEDGEIIHTPEGNLFQFQRMREDSPRSAGIAGTNINIGTVTERLPSTNYYTLGVKHSVDPTLDFIELTVVDSTNQEIDPNTRYKIGSDHDVIGPDGMFHSRIHLSDAEANHIRSEKEAFITYTAESAVSHDQTRISYQELVATKDIPTYAQPNSSITSDLFIFDENGLVTDTSPATTGEPITFRVQITNDGTHYSDHEEVLSVREGGGLNGVRKKSTLINPGESTTITFTHYIYEPGFYTFSVGDAPERTIRVTE